MTAGAARLAEVNARVNARSRPFAASLKAWLDRFGRLELKRALQDPYAYAGPISIVRKAETPEDEEEKLERDLEKMVRLFGMREAADAANRIAGRRLISSDLFRDALLDKPVKIVWFWEMFEGSVERSRRLIENTKNEARNSVKRIIEQSLNERNEDGVYVQPSPGEIARRIRTAFTGPGDIEREHRVHASTPGRDFIFSSSRAAIIARTELAQAENTGIMAGYEATGVEEIEWLGYASSTRHGSMRGKRIRIGEMFVLPNGDRLRYPGDPSGPIGSVINCRCTTRAVVTKQKVYA